MAIFAFLEVNIATIPYLYLESTPTKRWRTRSVAQYVEEELNKNEYIFKVVFKV